METTTLPLKPPRPNWGIDRLPSGRTIWTYPAADPYVAVASNNAAARPYYLLFRVNNNWLLIHGRHFKTPEAAMLAAEGLGKERP